MHIILDMKTTRTDRTRDELIATYRTLARSLADETRTEAEADAIRRQMRDVQAEIDAAA